MSTTIDSKVVQMKFDNAQFEKGVSTSMGTIEKLKKSLNFKESQESLSDLQSSAKKLDFSEAIKQTDALGKSFSFMGELATGAMRKLGADIETYVTSKLVNVAKELSGINNVSAGYQKYTTVTEAVQTMVAATGKTTEEIQEYITKLNWFSDETSYSLTDMTSALSKFVNAGVDLDTAVTAIEGISTWAAASGVNANNASSAFYNLSQAIGSGSLMAQDAMSLKNLSMMGPEFGSIALAAAEAAGTIKKVGDAYFTLDEKTELTNTNYASNLSSKWMTTDVMLDALNEYGKYATGLQEFMAENEDAYNSANEAMADYEASLEAVGKTEEYALAKKAFKMAQVSKTFGDAIDATKDAASTAWLNIIQSVIGNLDEAVELWTGVCNELWEIFVGPLVKLQEIMQEWHDLGGRAKLLEGLAKGWEAIKIAVDAVFGPIKALFNLDATKLLQFTGTLTHLMYSLKRNVEKNKETLEAFGKTVASAIQLIIFVFKGLMKVLSPILGIIKNIFSLVFNFIGKILVKLNSFFKVVRIMMQSYHFFDDIAKAFKNAVTGVMSVVNKFIYLIKLGAHTFMYAAGFSEKYIDTFGLLKKVITGIRDRLVNFFNLIGTANGDEFAKKFAGPIINIFGKLGSWFGRFIRDYLPSMINGFINFGGKVIDFINDLNLLEKLKGAFDWIANVVTDIFSKIDFGGILSTMVKWFNIAAEAVKNFFSQFSASDTWNAVVNWFANATKAVQNFFAQFDIHGAWTKTVQAVKDFFAKVFGTEAKDAENTINNTNESLAETETLLDKIKNKFKAIGEWFKGVWNAIAGFFIKVWEKIYAAFGPQIDAIRAKIELLIARFQSGELGIWDVLKYLIEAGILLKVATLVKEIFNTFTGFGKVENSLSKLLNSMKGVVNGVGDIFSGFANSLNAVATSVKSEALWNLAKSVALLVASMIALTFVDSEKLKTATGTILILVTDLMLAMKSMQSTLDGSLGSGFKDVSKSLGFTQMAKAMKSIAMGVLILVAAVWLLTKIDPDRLETGISMVSVLLTELTMAFKQMANTKHADKLGKSIKQMAVGIIILVAGIWLLGKMDPDRLEAGTKSLTTIMLLLGMFFTAFKNSKNTNFGALGETVEKMAFGILILVAAIWLLGSMDPAKLIAGTYVMAGIMIGIGVLINSINKAKAANMQVAANAMVTLSGALVAIAAGVLIIGLLPVSRIIAAGIVMIGIIGMIILLLEAFKMTAANASTLQIAMSAMVTLSGALVAIAAGILIIGLLPVKRIIAAGLVMMGIMGMMILFINSFKTSKAMAENLKKVSKALVTIAGAFVIMAAAMVALGSLSLPQLLIAVAGIAAIIGAFYIIKKLNLGDSISSFANGITKLAIAIAILMVGVGAGILMIGVGLDYIAKALIMFSLFKNTIVDGLKVMISVFGTLVTDVLLPTLVQIVKKLPEILAEGLPPLKDVIVEFIAWLIATLLDTLKNVLIEINNYLPEILEELNKTLFTILDWFITQGPTILAKVGEVLGILGAGFLQMLPGIVKFIGDAFITLLESLTDWLKKNDTRLVKAIHDFIEELLVIVCELLVDFGQSFVDLGIDIMSWIGKGLWDGLKSVGGIFGELFAKITKLWEDFWAEVNGGEISGTAMAIGSVLDTDYIKNSFTQDEIDQYKKLLSGDISLESLSEAEARRMKLLAQTVEGIVYGDIATNTDIINGGMALQISKYYDSSIANLDLTKYTETAQETADSVSKFAQTAQETADSVSKFAQYAEQYGKPTNNTYTQDSHDTNNITIKANDNETSDQTYKKWQAQQFSKGYDVTNQRGTYWGYGLN